jgi:hypothetical protein
VDDGCFLCRPEKHERPECPPTCPNFGKRIADKIKTGNVVISSSVLKSVAAALSAPTRERTEQEKAYDEVVRSVIIKDGHRQAERPKEMAEHGGQRLYMVTTIASSDRYGGTRTPVICTSFERAKEIVETNEGDIFECSYMLVVIEAVVADWLYGGHLNEQYWYVWKGDVETGNYCPIERPKAFESTINIGAIG